MCCGWRASRRRLRHDVESSLLGSARHAFVAGLDTMLWVCGGIALVSAILAVIFLPRRAEGAAGAAGVPAAVDISAGESGAERAEWEA